MGKTFSQARDDIIKALKAKKWTVKEGLKIPHATSPSGAVRLWFKPQAVWYTEGNYHQFSGARSIAYDLDIRRIDPDKFADNIEKFILG